MNEINTVGEKILCIRELRYSGGWLEQKLLISKPNPDGTHSDVEEWRPVCREEKRERGRPVGGNVDFWKSVNWDKSNLELSADHLIPTQTIAINRRKHGHKALPNQLRNYDWTGIDWTKNNQQIARETGRRIAIVASARTMLYKPKGKRRVDGIHCKVSQEQIDAADWLYDTDSELGRAWKVSRERVRQLRLELKKPECLLKHTQPGVKEAKKWLVQNRAMIEGTNAHAVLEMMPGVLRTPTKMSILKHSGINFDWSRQLKWGPESKTPLNFDLPNIWLTKIWKFCFNGVASCRYLHHAGRPKWKAGGGFTKKYLSDPEFIAAIKSEIAKAQAAGKPTTEKEIFDEIESRKTAIKHRRRAAIAPTSDLKPSEGMLVG